MATINSTPSIKSTAFACPHCGAYTSQHWFLLYARPHDEDARIPNVPDEATRTSIASDFDIRPEDKAMLLEWCSQMLSGIPYFEDSGKWDSVRQSINNLNISECFNCKKLAIWVHQSMVYPSTRMGPPPNSDLPNEILRDYEEARGIVNTSPRGAAALLRLAVQKLCAHLGERGKNIDDDIASLVSKGLDPLVQKALDIVRVIGNEAVHPGTFDLRDDQSTAIQLFELVNMVCQQMITQPTAIKALYETLPEGKRTAIDARNAKAPGNKA